TGGSTAAAATGGRQAASPRAGRRAAASRLTDGRDCGTASDGLRTTGLRREGAMRDVRRARLWGRPRHGTRASIAGMLIALFLPPAAMSDDNRAAARIEAMASILAKARRLAVAADCVYAVVPD